MFNNFQNLFQKYSQKISLQKDLEENVTFLIKDISGLTLQKHNLKIDQKDKTIKILNLSASQKFFLTKKVKENNLEEKIKTEFGFQIRV